MGAPLWTQEEKDCFLNFIIPQSQFSSGKYDSTTGLTWKELAPLMEEEMTRRGGYPALRVYTENALSQLYYNRFSARAISRGQSDMALMSAAPRTTQPPLRVSTASGSQDSRPKPADKRPATNNAYSRDMALPGGGRGIRYVTRFTQTDPNVFLGFSPEETLSVHADPIGHTSHELTSRGNRNRSDRDRRELHPPVEVIGHNQGQIEGVGDRKRGLQIYEEEVNNDQGNSQSNQKLETERNSRNDTIPAIRRDPPVSNNATSGQIELPDFEDSNPFSRSSLDRSIPPKWQKPKSEFAHEDFKFESLDESEEEEMTSLLRGPKSSRPNEEIVRGDHGYLDVQARWEDLEGWERRKRQKIDAAEVKQTSNPFALSELDESSDDDLQIYDEGPPRVHPRTIEVPDVFEAQIIEKVVPRKSSGMMVDGIYRPSQSYGFGIAALESNQPSAPAKSSCALKKTFEDAPSNSKASRHTNSAVTKNKEQKKANNPGPTKASAIKESKKTSTKIENRLPQVASKHPIGYTNRPVPFFESVNLPKILKKSAIAKTRGGEKLGGEQLRPGGFVGENLDQRFRDGYMGHAHDIRFPDERSGRPAEERFAGGKREYSNVHRNNTRKFGDKAEQFSQYPGKNISSTKSPARNDNLSSVSAQAAPNTASAVPTLTSSTNLSSVPKSEDSMAQKFATLDSIIAQAKADTRPEHAAPWAKVIAVQRGFRESISTVGEAVQRDDSTVGGDDHEIKIDSPKSH